LSSPCPPFPADTEEAFRFPSMEGGSPPEAPAEFFVELSDDAFCSVSAIEARRSIALPLRFATKVSHSRL